MPATKQAFYYQAVLDCEAGTARGQRFLAHCRVLAASDEEARRAVVGYIAAQSRPAVPANATPRERAHIEENWCRLRLRSLNPEPYDLSQEVPEGAPLFWWGWDEIKPADEVSE